MLVQALGPRARTPRHGEDISASCAFQRSSVVSFNAAASSVGGFLRRLLVSWLALIWDRLARRTTRCVHERIGNLSLFLIPSAAQLLRS